MREKSLTSLFDATSAAYVTQGRGEAYGPPLDDFRRVEAMKRALAACPHPGVRHALEMIAVKMSRLCHTPSHVDSLIDIAGYARCIAMLLDAENEEKDRPHALTNKS